MTNLNQGTKDQSKKASPKLKNGIKINKLFDKYGTKAALENNLTASAAGCGIPIKEGLLGPWRSWA